VLGGSPYTKKQLRDLQLPGALIAAVVRDGSVSIPSGDDKLEDGDKIMVICRREAIQHVQKGVGETNAHAKRVIIVGGGNIGLAIAQYFDYPRYRCTVFEPDRARAWQIAEMLRHVKVIEGDGADRSLLREESIEQTDAFVSCTGSDEKNLMTAVMAKDLGVPRTVAVVDKPQFAELGDKLGLTATLPPRILAASQVLSYIRGGQFNRISLIAEGQAEVVEFTVQQGSPLLRAPLMKLGLPKGLIVGALIRGNKAVVPKGADSMQAGDSVIMFALHEHLPYIESLLKAERIAAESVAESERVAQDHSAIRAAVQEVTKL
jgi:trk system potassium uptake protein TrkA